MNTPNPNKINYQILLDGEEVVNVLLGLTVVTEVNRIPRARLEFNYRLLEKNEGSQDDYILEDSNILPKPPKKNKADFMPGKKVEVKMSKGAGVALETVFEGYITKQNIRAQASGKLILRVDCRHKCQKMTLRSRTRFLHHHANKKANKEEVEKTNDEQLLKELINFYKAEKLTLKIDDPGKLSADHDNMLQYNCTDWDFLVIRAEALGYVVWPEGDQIRLLRPALKPTGKETFELGRNIFEYEANYDETIPAKEAELLAWDIQKTTESQEKLVNNAVNGDFGGIQSNITLNQNANLSEEEAKAWLENEQMRQEKGLVQAVLKINGTVKITVNDTISILGFESVWDRDTYVSGIKHQLKNGSWHTWVQCGISKTPHAEKYDISAKEAPFIPKADGLIYGVVKGNIKNKGGYEMVEVEIPANYENVGEKTIYARLATFAAGEKGGAVFRPFEGDEVVIGFIDNDPRFPILLGSLYTPTNEPGYEWNDSAEQEEVGFTMEDWKFSIQTADKVLKIESPDAQQFIIDNGNQSQISMIYDGDNSIEVNKKGIILKGKSITLESQQGDVKMSGKSIEASAQTGLKLEANTQLELEGKVTASLKGQITQIN